MESDIELGKQLIDELVDLWVETKDKCERIEELVKKLENEINLKRIMVKNQGIIWKIE